MQNMVESRLPIYGFPAHTFCLSHKCFPLSVPYVWVGRRNRGVGTPIDGMAEQDSLFSNTISTWLLPQKQRC